MRPGAILLVLLMAVLVAISTFNCQAIFSVDRSKLRGGVGGVGGGGQGGVGGVGGGGQGGVGGVGGGGQGGAPVCDPIACDGMDDECFDFTCDAGLTTCEGMQVTEGGPCLTTSDNMCDASGTCVCNPATCDALDQECLDVACNVQNAACDRGTAVPVGQPCILTSANICNSQGMCVSM